MQKALDARIASEMQVAALATCPYWQFRFAEVVDGQLVPGEATCELGHEDGQRYLRCKGQVKRCPLIVKGELRVEKANAETMDAWDRGSCGLTAP